jgi:hypothetical protein
MEADFGYVNGLIFIVDLTKNQALP